MHTVKEADMLLAKMDLLLRKLVEWAEPSTRLPHVKSTEMVDT
jgi:hypothetical protein